MHKVLFGNQSLPDRNLVAPSHWQRPPSFRLISRDTLPSHPLGIALRKKPFNYIKLFKGKKASPATVTMAISHPSPVAQFAGWLTAFALGAYLFYILFSFARAYADLSLMSKRRRVPGDAFRQKVVWIVGASQGLGEELALYFAKSGAKLILSSRSRDKLDAVKQRCLAENNQIIDPEQIILLPLDLTGGAEDLETAVSAAYDAFNASGVDYVIHNAGASQQAAAEETTADVATALVNLNLLGPMLLAQATLPRMIKRGCGHHVVVASMSAVVPSPGQAIYAATKSGLKAYFESVAAELGGNKNGPVKVTVCCPGPIQTGSESSPRMVYGPRGLVQKHSTTGTGLSSKRLPATLVAELIGAATWHDMNEAWMAFHPVLLIGYLSQYIPPLAKAILAKIGPGRVKQFKDGSGSGYDVMSMLGK